LSSALSLKSSWWVPAINNRRGLCAPIFNTSRLTGEFQPRRRHVRQVPLASVPRHRIYFIRSPNITDGFDRTFGPQVHRIFSLA
jgi:hypothetical protein